MAEIPFVSVIVAVYNEEKYIGELLDSMLAQTLKNFELFVVNNGCIDNSQSVVDSYLPKFNGRLKTFRIKVNVGNPAPARNKALELSLGKYVFFIDSDDILLPTALEDMYTAAEKFQADAVYLENHAVSSGMGQEFLKNAHIVSGQNQVKQPVLVNFNAEQKMQAWIDNLFSVPPWNYFVRRDFLIGNNIDFAAVFQDDSIWSFKIVFLAKNLLIIPNICYLVRIRQESLSAFSREETISEESSLKNIRRKLERTILALTEFENFLRETDIFKDNPALCYEAVSNFMNIDLAWTLNDCLNLSLAPHEIYEIIKSKFKDDTGEQGTLIAHLCANNIRLINEVLNYRKLIENIQSPPPRMLKLKTKNPDRKVCRSFLIFGVRRFKFFYFLRIKFVHGVVNSFAENTQYGRN